MEDLVLLEAWAQNVQDYALLIKNLRFPTYSKKSQKNVIFFSKRAPSRKKTWSFEWKIENRPSYEDFEKKILDPQLNQTFKPIGNFSALLYPYTNLS